MIDPKPKPKKDGRCGQERCEYFRWGVVGDCLLDETEMSKCPAWLKERHCPDIAFVVCCNDSPEFLFLDQKKAARLCKRYNKRDNPGPEHARVLYWHIHEVQLKV